jgi:hypothetical protein
MIDFSRRNGLEVFWSLRMNDTHDGSTAIYGPANLKANRFKTAHPEFMLGKAKQRPKHGAWTALDFGQPEVREHAFRLIEEVCRNYDVDGIELDFFRHPVYFRSTARGDKASDADRAAMTELVTRVRALVDEVGTTRKRPMLMAFRGPDSLEYCRDIGLDLERWLADGLFDLVVASSYFQLNEWDYSVALGRKYGVKVYPSLDESRLRDTAGLALRRTKLAYRARAAEVWMAGADGVYVFNFPFDTDSKVDLYREMGSAEGLATLDKDYFASVRGFMNSAGGNLPYAPYIHIETLNPDNPITIAPGKAATVKLNVAESFDKARPKSMTLRLQVKDAKGAEAYRVRLNGREMAAKVAEGGWVECTPSTSDVRRGVNEVELNVPAKSKKAVWADLMLQVRYGQ